MQSASTIKTCFKCGASKPLSDFYVHKMMADGHLGKCKECAKKDVKERYKQTREARHAYERSRAQSPGRRRAAFNYQRRRRARHPEKAAARNAVANALRDGRLIKGPCRHCGATKNMQAHHDDYSKPLDVEWLCFTCHREERHGQIVSQRLEETMEPSANGLNPEA